MGIAFTSIEEFLKFSLIVAIVLITLGLILFLYVVLATWFQDRKVKKRLSKKNKNKS